MRLLLPLLAACGLTHADLRDVVEAHDDIVSGTHAQLELIEEPLDGARHGSGDGRYIYDGELVPAGLWDAGTVTVTGDGVIDGVTEAFELALVYDGVRADGIVFDGEMALTLVVIEDAGWLTVDYDAVGTVAVSEGARGDVALDVHKHASSHPADPGDWWSGTANGVSVDAIGVE